MIIDKPRESDLPEMRAVWREAFGDSDAEIDLFMKTAFSPDRARIAYIDSSVASALYWLDCDVFGEKYAYIYAVATAEKFRGRGACTALMKNTHIHLKSLGYAAAILVPSSVRLFDFYARIGYEKSTYVDENCINASKSACDVRKISPCEYGKIRRKLLPRDAVIQENESLEYLGATHALYYGGGALLAARGEGDTLVCAELLGRTDASAEIAAALGYSKIRYRTQGSSRPFSMWYPLKPALIQPSYLGLAFD
jgi:predicted N-acetyltransferase YhbS